MPSPVAQGSYLLARVDGDRVVSAGMTPRNDDQHLIQTGVVGTHDGVSIEKAKTLAEVAGNRAVDACASVIPADAELLEVIWLIVYVRSESDFTQHSGVADGAASAIHARLGGELPARAAVGVTSLPGGAPVEVQLGCRWSAT